MSITASAENSSTNLRFSSVLAASTSVSFPVHPKASCVPLRAVATVKICRQYTLFDVTIQRRFLDRYQLQCLGNRYFSHSAVLRVVRKRNITEFNGKNARVDTKKAWFTIMTTPNCFSVLYNTSSASSSLGSIINSVIARLCDLSLNDSTWATGPCVAGGNFSMSLRLECIVVPLYIAQRWSSSSSRIPYFCIICVSVIGFFTSFLLKSLNSLTHF